MASAYLDVRVAFALARIASLTDPTTGLLRLALADAQALGYRDAESSALSDLPTPTFFADEPSLAQAWRDGFIQWESDGEYGDMCFFCFDDHNVFQCPRI
ncbi:hypothetical protein [Paraburkholderia diazotrophica]|uniref:Uncharacterized protein n=1 Tax=Paraburkholderia diazotrophica TaxID=667676 RepID=A0A1H7EE67_9BURK|nr:hypothetical protein [Paraburkholderia diazotrophica]SEK10362.1 hypothetical protein SAMN05192539_104761 [Paraburkholderia diazotrophica]